MGTIKDITDLTINLINSTQDRKLTTKITAIQSLIATLQSEHSTTIEENLALRKKIFELEKGHTEEISNLKKEIFAVQEKFSAINLRDRYDFVKELGIYKSKDSGHYFCTSCLMKNIESPLTDKQNGWRCELKDCDKFYSNPSYHDKQPQNLDWNSF